MKNWLTIGQFAKRSGFSPKALRLYEKMGLIASHARGENDYRYFEEMQLQTAARIKELKDLGFTLNETKDLLHIDGDLNSDKLQTALLKRRELISAQADVLRHQKYQVDKILASLENKQQPLKAEQRRAIMSFYGNVSILVTGVQGLEKTAVYTQQLFQKNGKSVPILHWKSGLKLPSDKPYILVCPESRLDDSGISEINADTIVIKNMGTHSEELKKKYLQLFTNVGPHVNTIFNADDVASIDLAAEAQVKKSRYVYFSKNKGLKPQIKNIGGIVSDGEEVFVYGFNLKNEIQEFKIGKIMAFEEEISYIAAVGSVMNLDFEPRTLSPTE